MRNPLILGLFAGLLVFGGSQVRRFERTAAQDIRKQLSGQEAKVSVHVRPAGLSGALASATIEASHFSTDGLPLFTEPDRSTRGVVHELRMHLSDFRLRGIRIEQLDATIPDCRFDYSYAVRHGKIRLSRSGVGVGSVLIRDRDLEAFILRKLREIKRVSVRIGDGRIHVEGYSEFLVFSTAFTVDARLEAPDGIRLMLTDAKITLDGNGADDAAGQALLSALNPVVDLDKDLHLFGAIKVRSIKLENGTILASGTTQVPSKPSPAGR